MKIALPISIDRWSNPISSKFRELVRHSRGSGIDYYSISNPDTEEDKLGTPSLWTKGLNKLTISALLTKRFDIVHRSTATRGNNLITKWIQRRSNHVKKVYTVGVEPHKSDKYHHLISQAIDNADFLIANSNSVALALKRFSGRTVDKIILNGIDSDFFDPERANTHTLKKFQINTPYFLFNSAMLERKRPDIYISLARMFPDLQFVMIGRPTSLNEKYLGEAPENVVSLGQVSKVESRDISAFAQALIFPSELEGLPNAVIEAVTLGTPVIAQNVSSLPEIINDSNGWLLNDTSVLSWCAYVEMIMSMSNEEKVIKSRNARADALARFSWQKYADEHVSFYKRIVNV